MQSLFLILNRNRPDGAAKYDRTRSSRFSELVHFIHEHIYEHEKIQSAALAERFGFSVNYLGAFFKRETGQTLRNYIQAYKIELIRNRLSYSTLPIKVISTELGFTDLSHFNKYVRRLTGKSPGKYRSALRSS
ncbi:hypothetical protein C7T94_13485 [Pedobacter yulinensis]|uniref:HTH araC/xylS-type domain-containing protein n=2 Tax=Pedobacter yulinensis TaxID=2126353 RepID=A0A2T3HNA1_9SPHI|nr:hypothetical protein C7T94_13485 [Pedobacter yulinensis]